MNEQAIKNMYDISVQNGYTKSIDEFKTLLGSNQKAFQTVFDLAVQNGYTKNIDDFSVLMGVKKKEEGLPAPNPSQQPTAQAAPSVATASPSDATSSASPSVSSAGTATPFEWTAPSKEKAQPGQGVSVTPAAAAMGAAGIEKKQKLEKEAEEEYRKKADNALVSGVDFDRSINEITPEFINRDEDAVASELQSMFKDYGFTVSEARPGLEGIEVSAPNPLDPTKTDKINIGVDAWTDAQNKEWASDISQWIGKHKPAIKKKEEELNIYQQRIRNDRDLDNANKSFNEQVTSLNKEYQQLILDKSSLEQEMKELTDVPMGQRQSPEYIERVNAFEAKRNELLSRSSKAEEKQKHLEGYEKDLKISVGRYATAKSEQGSLLGLVRNNLIQGVASMDIGAIKAGRTIKFGVEDLVDYATGNDQTISRYRNTEGESYMRDFVLKAVKNGVEVPKELLDMTNNPPVMDMRVEGGMLSYDQKMKAYSDAFKNWKSTIGDGDTEKINNSLLNIERSKSDALSQSIQRGADVYKSSETTKEYEQAGIIKQSVSGLAASVPAMLMGGGSVPAFFLQGYGSSMQEMEGDSDFNEVNPYMKAGLASSIGIVNAVLENYGFRNALSKSGLINNLAAKALTRAGKTTTATSFKNLVENEVESAIARGLLTVTAAGLAESETGAAQYAAETGIKELYNIANEKKMFDTPDNVKEFGKELLISGVQEAIGGHIMGVMPAIATAYSKNNFNGISDDDVLTFRNIANDTRYFGVYANMLKSSVAKGIISSEVANNRINDYRNAVSVMNSVPENMTPAQQRQALGLILERKKLEAEKEGKEPSLVKKQVARINEINAELDSMSEKVPSYSIDGQSMSRSEFINAIDKMTPEQAQSSNIEMTNPEQKVADFVKNKALKKEQDAIQEQGAEGGVLRPEGPEVELPTVGERDQAKEFAKKSFADAEQAKQVELPKIETVEQNEAGISTGEKPEKILFLDVNGVINAQSSRSGDVLPQLMAYVNKIIEETGAKVVISSDERMGELNATREKMKQYGFKHADKIIGETSVDKEGDQEFRGDRIENWKNTFAPDATIVALDDNDPRFSDNQKSSLVSPSSFLGMNEDLANKAIAKLNRIAGSEAEAIEQNAFPSEEKLAALDEMEENLRLERNLAAATTEAPTAAPTEAPTSNGVSIKDATAANELIANTPDTTKAKVIRQAMKAVKTVQSIFPSFDIVVHENEDSFNDAMGKYKGQRSTAGNIARIKDSSGNVSVRIDINLSKADATTVAHEVAHAVMLKSFGDDPKLFKVFRDRISKILSVDRNKELNDFANQYDESDSYEEFLVQLAAVLSANKETLNKVTVSKILELINKMVSKITGGAFVPFKSISEATATNDLVDFFNNMSRSISAGEGVELGKKGEVKIAEGVVSKGQKVDKYLEAELQLKAEPYAAKQEMIDEATRLMEEQEKKGFSENAFDATAPEPTIQPITIEVKENTPLAKKVKRMGLSELIGKKINLVMADQLKVGDVSVGKKMLKRMGGPFFPLIDGLFGKVAWASINKSAAASIVNGAVKSDYTVVYNMNPSAIDSNSALRETFIETVKSMPKAERDTIISQMLDQLKGKEFGKKTNEVRLALSKVKNFAGFEKAMSDFDVDTKAAVMNLILPSRDVKANTDIGKTLQEKGITIESLREQNIEQFVADLPAGALTMVLEVHDKKGNRVTNETKNEAIMTREQQEAEGLPIHDNYPFYVRGKAIGLLKETVPFWNLLKDSMNNINVKVANIVKKAGGESITAREARAQEMRSASMTANIAKKVVAPMATEYEKFISLLSRSFPNVEVITSQEQFDNLLNDLNAKQLVTKNQKVYGAVVNGKVYLNPSLENYNTPIHELGHIWTNVVETVSPKLYNKGIDLVANSEYVKRVIDNKDYQRVIKNMRKAGASNQEIQTYINKEALATAIGDKGESFVIAAQKKDFKNWLNRLYSLVKNLTGISKYTAEQLEDITLEEFTKAVSVDLMSGTELFKNLQSEKLSEKLQLSTIAKPEIVSKSQRAEKVSKLENILSAYELSVSGGYSKEEQSRMSANERRSASIRTLNAKKKLDTMLGFDIGDLPSQTDKQKEIRNAISYLNRLVGVGRFAEYNDVKELLDAYEKAKEDNSNPELVKSVEAIIGEPEIISKSQKADVKSTARKLEESFPNYSYSRSQERYSAYRNAGLVWHAGESKIKSLDVEKIKGGLRAELGYGFYFSSGSKVDDYGQEKTFLNASKLNLIDADSSVRDNGMIQKLKDYVDYPSRIKSRISRLEDLLVNVKNNRDYNDINADIKSLEQEFISLDKESISYAKGLLRYSESNPYVSVRDLAVRGSDSQNKLFSKIMTDIGYDGAQVSDNWQLVIYPKEGINDLIVDPNEFTAEEYQKAKEDNSNPELVKSVEAIIGEPEIVSKSQVSGFHGSPYDFERFTTEKIGTGEGAQAFGWGLYFTDVKSIAEHYRKALSGDVLSLNGKDYKLNKDGSNDDLRNDYPDIYYVRGLLGESENVESAKWAILDYLSSNKQKLGNSFYETANRAIKSLESLESFESKKSGKLYQVSLHQGKTPDQYTWLEWDKPISRNVDRYLYDYAKRTKDRELIDMINAPNGKELYERLVDREGSQKNASLFLLKAGIDGVKYPAESISRGATSETARGSNYVIFDENAVTIVSKSQKAEKLSEANMPGYDATMEKVGGIIAKTVDRGGTKEQAFDNVMRYLEKSKLYTDATDVQREQLVRDIRDRFYKKEKSAPSAERLLGIKDTKKVTMSEKEALKRRLTDEARGARNAASAIKKSYVAISEELKEMVKSGKISLRQMNAILNRFAKLKVLDESSVSNFVDYMSNVIENAEYMETIASIKKMIPTAKKNVAVKLGIAEGLVPNLQRMLNLNPEFIPAEVFNTYMQLVQMVGKRERVLTLEEINKVTDMASEVMDAVDNKFSVLDDLYDRFINTSNVVFNKEGKLDYAETLKAMEKAGEISADERDMMNENKSKIYSEKKGPTETMIGAMVSRLINDGQDMAEAVSNTASNLGISEDDVNQALSNIEQERQQLIGAVYSSSVEIDPEVFPTEDERVLAKKLKKLLSSDAVESMSLNDLRNIVKMIDNMKNGYISNFAEVMENRLQKTFDSMDVMESAVKANPMSISKMIAKLKTLFKKGENYIDEITKRGINYYIDQSLGDFKTKRVFNAIFERSAEGLARFESEVNRLTSILDKAQERIAKSHSMNHNAIVKAKMRMMAYMLQKEYETNEGANVIPAIEHLKETLKFMRTKSTMYSESDIKMLEEVIRDYSTNGQIDLLKLEASLNPAEKSAISSMNAINEMMRSKAVYTSTIIRGEKIRPLNNYIHHAVMYESKDQDRELNTVNDSMKPSTRAKSLVSRTGKATPLHMDPFYSVHKGAKSVLTDYYLTSPVRTARMALAEAKAKAIRDGADRKTMMVLESIENAFETSLAQVLGNSFGSNSTAEAVINIISKNGYRAVLASSTRAVAELASNIGFAVWVEPQALMSSKKYWGMMMSEDAAQAMFVLKSKQTNRLYPSESLSGRLIDPSIINQVNGIKNAKTKGAIANKINQIYNMTGSKYLGSVELIADFLISTPDKLIMRPIWFGSFANEFKKMTGKDPDFERIAANDAVYMAENAEALENARNVADEASVRAASSNNAFMTSIKGRSKDGKVSVPSAIWNNFNNFMTTFLQYEYITARTGIMAAMGSGMVSREKGLRMLAGVTTRMMVYGMLSQTLANGLFSAITGGDDDEEQDEKSFLQSLGQQFASAFTSLMFGRDFGQGARTLINYGIEFTNENYLDFLRSGEYDPYKDALQYTMIPHGGKKAKFSEIMMKMGGSFGPGLSTAGLIFDNMQEEDKKEEGARLRQERENFVRIPLEVAGNAGLVPLYKDVDRMVKKWIYSDLEKKKSQERRKEKEDKEKLMGYPSRREFKRVNPELYKQVWGDEPVERREAGEVDLMGYPDLETMKKVNPELYKMVQKGG